MPIASKSPEKMCRPQNSQQCMSRIPGAGFGTCRTFAIASSTRILSIPQFLVRDMTYVLAIKFC